MHVLVTSCTPKYKTITIASGINFFSKFTRFSYYISLFLCYYINLMKHTHKLRGWKSDALYAISSQCFSLLNWKLKSENCFPPQNIFDGSAIRKISRSYISHNLGPYFARFCGLETIIIHLELQVLARTAFRKLMLNLIFISINKFIKHLIWAVCVRIIWSNGAAASLS